MCKKGSLLRWDHGGGLLLSEPSAVRPGGWCIDIPPDKCTYLIAHILFHTFLFCWFTHQTKCTYLKGYNSFLLIPTYQQYTHGSASSVCTLVQSVECKHKSPSQSDSPALETYTQKYMQYTKLCIVHIAHAIWIHYAPMQCVNTYSRSDSPALETYVQ